MIAVAALAFAAAQDKVNVSGEWQITIVTDQGTFTPRAIFQQDGEKLTGDYHGAFGHSKLSGTLQERAIKFQTTLNAQGQSIEVSYSGTVESGETMKGKVELGELGSAEWTAKRKAKEKEKEK